MRKHFIILLVVIISSFLLGFLFLKENSPFVSLMCKPIVGAGCQIDLCGTCVNKEKKDTVLVYRTGSLDTYIGCETSLSLIDTRGTICGRSNYTCQFHKTWRTAACEPVSKLHAKIRIDLGLEGKDY
jgi:hypothetical protein